MTAAATLPSGRIFGVVHSYDDLHVALRARVEDLAVAHTAIDERAGWTEGYAGKLLSPAQTRRLGPLSLDAILPTLGLVLVVIEDPEILRRRPLDRRDESKHGNAA